MTTVFTKATLALALGATALTAAAPAEAQRYGGRHRGNDNGGIAIIAGIAGLAIGAAIASSANDRRRGHHRGYRQNGYRETYVDDGYSDYRDDRGYDDRRAYDRDNGYNGYDRRDGYGQRGYGSCHVETRWDDYSGQRTAVRVCN
ncbi:hypothetical protein G4G27_14500 [Sphingomonas sp. So64.6b]|uniref:hypothetical protein n=1 Tax=Sphingomonas sp. So64.6b TaxID=2997354 RepID=UPI001602C4EF|nr:hypothetical protein [Sphingomonas sp. So64.6b]QNA85073.1 hypothetical protein G4G27_14500 [Sphingomonas sp. So64.6b]